MPLCTRNIVVLHIVFLIMYCFTIYESKVRMLKHVKQSTFFHSYFFRQYILKYNIKQQQTYYNKNVLHDGNKKGKVHFSGIDSLCSDLLNNLQTVKNSGQYLNRNMPENTSFETKVLRTHLKYGCWFFFSDSHCYFFYDKYKYYIINITRYIRCTT